MGGGAQTGAGLRSPRMTQACPRRTRSPPVHGQ
jgi:hypothetical protein